jgi:hypothetical protein
MTKLTSIGLPQILKLRLERAKGNKAHSTYIDSMLNYFEITGIEPSSIKVHPGIETIQRIESVIKILKNIEKTKLNPLLDKIDLLSTASYNSSSTRASQITDEEVNSLADLVERLNKEVSEKKRQISNLESEIKILKDKLSSDEPSNFPNRTNEALELIDLIFDSNNATFDRHSNSYIIPKGIYDKVIEKKNIILRK